MHAMQAIPDSFLQGHPPNTRASRYLATIIFEIYIKDVVQFVKSKVSQVLLDLGKSEDKAERLDATNRAKFLRQWCKAENPLDYLNYKVLCQTIDSDAAGLPRSSQPHLGVELFIDTLVEIGWTKPLSKRTSIAPFVPEGSLQSVLHFALSKMKQYTRVTDRKGFIVDTMNKVWPHMRISFIPWIPKSSNNRHGRPSQQVAWYAWSTFTVSKPPQHLEWDQAAALEESQLEASSADPYAHWAAADITIQGMSRMLKCRVLPDDWTTPKFSMNNPADAYVQKTYEFVMNTLDLEEPLHHLALIIGVIFSKLAPDVYLQKPENLCNQNDMVSRREVKKYLDRCKWTGRHGKRGAANGDVYVAMVTTYIIAIYDPRSPLRQYFAQHNSFGSAWQSKHRMYNPVAMILSQKELIFF
jgi:hypothetical protein